MDKNKSRTDLLAAGRKKLQQFRQKKDGKVSGSHVKSSKKSSKSEQQESDVDALSNTTDSTALPQVPEGENASPYDSNVRTVESLVSDSTENSVAPDVNIRAFDPLSISITPERTDNTNINKLEVEAQEDVIGSSNPNKGKSFDVSVPPASIDYRDDSNIRDEVNSRNREEEGSSHEDSPNMSLIHARGNQVTDVGAIQEADSLGLKQCVEMHVMKREGDGMFAFSEYGNDVETPALEQTGMEDMGSQLAQNDLADDESASASDMGMPNVLMASTLSPVETVGASGVHEVANQSEAAVVPSYIEDSEMLSEAGHFGENKKDNLADRIMEACKQEYMPEESFIFVDKSHEDLPLAKFPNSGDNFTTCPPGGVCPISFSQLIELIKGLNEEEFKLLLMSRESNCSSISLHHDFDILMERLREELCLTSCMKDILHLLLTEQSNLQTEHDNEFQKLGGEIAVLQASLNEARERRDSLAEELAGCRSELQATISGREELQFQFHAAKAEVEEASARASELQKCLEKSQSDLLSLSKELADSKGLLVTVNEENENLKQTIALLSEERKKLGDEFNAHLSENEKLSKELADCNNLLAALGVESSDLRRTLALFTEKSKRLEEEKVYLATENEKLSMNLSGCKDLIEALEVENVNLRVELSIVTEVGKKLEEDQAYSVNEMERLSSELLVLQERSSKGHGKQRQLELELKEVTMRLEKLTEENVFLRNSIEMHENKLREFNNMQDKRSSVDGETPCKIQSLELQRSCFGNEAVDDQSHEKDGKQDGEATFSMLEKSMPDSLSGGPPLESFELEVYNDSSGFVVFKRQLEEAEKILQKLENAIEGMRSHVGLMNRSGAKLAAPAVSKLIQAFESKSHHEEHEAEETTLIEDQLPEQDPFLLTKECAGDLRATLRQLALDAVNVSSLFNAERESRAAANTTIKDLEFRYESMEQYTENLEATNIEFGVLYEAAKLHASDVKEKNEELKGLYETLKQNKCDLIAENNELDKTLSKYELEINGLQSQLHDLQLSSDEQASALHGQLEKCQKEAVERALTAKQEWNSIVSQILEALKRLDGSTGLVIEPVGLGSADIRHATSSVDAIIETIETLKDKLEVAPSDYEVTVNLFKEVNEKCNELLRKSELAILTLDRLYSELKKLVVDSSASLDDAEIGVQDEKLPDPLDYNVYKTLLEQLENVVAEKLQLQSINGILNLELMNTTKDVEEMRKTCADMSTIEKLMESVEGVVKLEDSEMELDGLPVSRLESLVSSLVRKCKDTYEQVSSSKNEFESKVEELAELQEKVYQLNALKLQHETENLLLKEHLGQVEDVLSHVQADLQEKVSELEQSEQKVSSLREKLSIAVAKGKGLVNHRDNLKKSLSETSSELERCSQELQLKEATLHELENKLKTCSEVGERVEALESELSYIRNSATALRESFLLKDSVLQRIEEILEDLDLPENFHSRGIIEKVDWLARSATGNSLLPIEWDQKSSVGGSYSDAGFVVMDAWKDDAPSNSTSGEDLRRKYEDLHGKFYGLAEQNEMLEQSLMERNQLVQRWEELLDKIDMPAHLRSVEPEDRIEWLGSALFEAKHDRSSLLQKIGNLENHCSLLTAELEEAGKRISCLNAELEESQKRISDIEINIQAVMHERESLSNRLEILNCDHGQLSVEAVQFALDNEKLQNEVTSLQEKLVQKLGNEEQIKGLEGKICRLQDLVCDALMDPGTKNLNSGGDSFGWLEGLVMRLIEKYNTLSVEKHHAKEAETNVNEGTTRCISDVESDAALMKIDAVDSGETNVDSLKKQLDETLSELAYVKEERDISMEKQQSLVCEVAQLESKSMELQELLNQEEQKSASLREKLNVAVKKGKSLVQLRDSLKKTTEELSAELEHLKSEVKCREDALAGYELKMRDFTSFSERVETLESENLFMRNRLAENDSLLQEKERLLSMILNALGDIDVGGETYNSHPVKKLEHIAKLCCDLQAAVAVSEEECRKSRRAAELLLAELNEVQERNDNLQEELANITAELAQLSKDREEAEATKFEAHSRFEKLLLDHTEHEKKKSSELVLLKSAANELRQTFFDITDFLAGFFYEDLKFLQNLESGMKSCLQSVEITDDNAAFLSENKINFMGVDFSSQTNMADHFNDDSIVEVCSYLQEFIKEIASIKAVLHEHSVTFHQQVNIISKLMESIQRDATSQKESVEALQRDIQLRESFEIEKEMEIVALRRNVALLYETCSSSLMEIDNQRAEVANFETVGDKGTNLKPAMVGDGGISSGGLNNGSSEEHVRDISERLLSVVKNFASLKREIVEDDNKEMKIIISNLQKELQEKDIQRERLSKDFVSQIKQAEATATSYSLDLQTTKRHVIDLEKKVEMLEDERNLLDQRVKELLQDQQTTSTELQEKIKFLTDMLSAKDQEIEALMQALDEEEIQLEDLTKAVEELEKTVRQRNLDIENLEASRGKAVKRLSITVSKFDELHHFSESLLAEVEKLQLQLHDRDSEISFLRKEVTRFSIDASVASKMSSKRNSDEISELLTWLGTVVSLHDDFHDDSQVHDCKEIIQKKITSILSELEDLRVAAQNSNVLLQMERNIVEDLTRREKSLAKSLHEKESQINMLAVTGELGQPTNSSSEISEVKPVINKWTVPGPSNASQVRSLRKVNNDQVSIAIDMDPSGSDRIEDEDDEKVHGFKSLASSRIVPKFTRPAVDMIDGLWVSCDRALMRQPTLRLGIMIYWAILHALLAAFVV